MHWTYAPADKADKAQLLQGDILKRTDSLEALLREVHPHFVNPKYVSFMVLTQSCDLVRRPQCKSPYITIAVVRHAEAATKTALAQLCRSRRDTSFCDGAYVTDKHRQRFEQEVEKLVNNNLADYFFLKADNDVGLATDWCAFLRVSIALRAQHYDTLLAAKMCQLSEVFQAKLGWLVGNSYSRVGTLDWSGQQLKDLVSSFTTSACEWVESTRFQAIQGELKKRKVEATPVVVAELIKDDSIMPKSAEDLIESAVRAAWGDETKRPGCDKFIRALKSTPEFRGFRQAASRSDGAHSS